MLTHSNSPVQSPRNYKLDWLLQVGVMKLLYAIEGFECSKDARMKENYFTAFSTSLARMHTKNLEKNHTQMVFGLCYAVNSTLRNTVIIHHQNRNITDTSFQ